ncbi:MAG: Spy/CpxP family protein refolding chaperone, partial [Gemmatimonadaceae bacterium]
MRRIAFLTLAAVSFAACSTETTAPNTSDLNIDAGAFGTALTVAGGYEAEVYQTRLVNGLPDSLRLTDAQQAKVKALIVAFNAATKADREALYAILREAHDAAKGKDRSAEDAVRKILATGVEIRVRLAAAEAKLKTDIDAILTADQRAWLASHQPKKCRPDKFNPLSDAQKVQIKALEKAFQDNNKADLQAVKTAYESAEGKTKAERDAIRATVAPAIARLDA